MALQCLSWYAITIGKGGIANHCAKCMKATMLFVDFQGNSSYKYFDVPAGGHVEVDYSGFHQVTIVNEAPCSN
jgi:hypothetical protein